MKVRRGLFSFGSLLFAVLLLAACSGSGGEVDDRAVGGGASEATSGPVEPANVQEQCQAGAARVVDRLDEYLGDFEGMTPDEFLAQDEIPGLAEFQNDIAQVLSDTANQNSTSCNLDGLQEQVDAQLGTYAADEDLGVLASYVVSSIRFGGNLEVADVAVNPSDDLQQIVSLLDNGSTVTLAAGTYTLADPLLIARSIRLLGAGQGETVIASAATDAVVAAFGIGVVGFSDLSIVHTGDVPASVLLGFGAPVRLENVTLSGGVADDEAGGGNGLLLTQSDPAGGSTVEGDIEESYIARSEIVDNMVAGIAVTGSLTPTIENNDIRDNALCGLCFLEESGGLVTANTVSGSDFGIQVGDQAAPRIVQNELRENNLVGVVLLGTNRAIVEQNMVVENVEVGIAAQESNQAVIRNNTVGAHPVGITVVNDAKPTVNANQITGADIGIQVGESAVPTVSDNLIADTITVGILVRETSAGTFTANEIRAAKQVGMLIEGEAKPTISGLVVAGAEVGVSYRETAGGELVASAFSGVSIGVQLEDQASPEVSENTFDRPASAAVVSRSTGNARILSSVVIEPETLAFGAAGSTNVLFKDNEVIGGETAVSAIEESVAKVENNQLDGQVVAIQVGDDAAPEVVGNNIIGASGAAIVYRDRAAGSASFNSILNPGSVGIQAIDQATPELRNNLLVAGLETPQSGVPNEGQTGGKNDPENGAENDPENDPENGAENDPENDPENGGENDPEDGAENDDEAESDSSVENGPDSAIDPEATVGFLYAGSAGGIVAENDLLGFSIGVQVGEQAAPVVSGNQIDGGQEQGVGFLIRDEAAGEFTGNTTLLHSIAFQIGGDAAPVVTGNTVEWASDVGFLIRELANPVLDENVCVTADPGIALLDGVAPELGDNDCSVATG